MLTTSQAVIGLPAPRSHAETVPPTLHPPLYAELVRDWQAFGRTAPGVPDPEWDALTGTPQGRSPDTVRPAAHRT